MDSRRLSSRAARIAGIVATLAVASVGCDRVRAAVGAAPPLHGTVYETPAPAPPLRLPQVAGPPVAGAPAGGTPAAGTPPTARFDLGRDGAQHAVLVFFGYTHCPDVCPTTLADWTRVRRLVSARAAGDSARIRYVFVTVDPERDSAAVVARYLGQFGSGVVGLAGSTAAIDTTLAAWSIATYRQPAPAPMHHGGMGHAMTPDTTAAYVVAHPTQVFLVGPDGRLRTVYATGVAPGDVAADLHTVLSGG